ncbi:MAG: dihydropteroate synthase [Chloroflexota bacterium]
MLVVGEWLNATNKAVGAAISGRDAGFVQSLASRQVEAGATMLDVNAGSGHGDGPGEMEWLVRTVQKAVDVPLCIDSTDPLVIERGLAAHRGRALVNSVSGEEGRVEGVLPLVKKYGADVVGLAVGPGGMPSSAADRLQVAQLLIEAAKEYEVPPQDVYIDPAVLPASVDGNAVGEVLRAIEMIKSSLGTKVILGLSNVSFGLPNRRLLNRTFLAMAVAVGLDAAILDPIDVPLMSVLKAAEALLGKDEFCLAYIRAYRQGQLG